ncbi:MAG TPA: hypothetical protein VFU02_07820, partial [Polyangiaceae bacterium]|nr:hypothetical protein [Polyangiaceae bacterium]
MRLSDIMSAAGLAFYAEVALGLFMFAFALIGLSVVARRNRSTWEHARWMPLSEDQQREARRR